MPTFPNPALHDLYQRDIVTLWDAARAIGVKPNTLRVWESRGKIERISAGDGIPLYHLPTIKRAVQVKPGRPRLPDRELIAPGDPPPLPAGARAA